MQPQRKLKDASLNLSKYLPAEGTSNQTLTIDSGEQPNAFEIEVVVPALPNNTDDTKTITLRLQDSDDNVTYADANPRVECCIDGVPSTGSIRKVFRVAISSTVRRYLQFTQTTPSGAGDNTGALVTYEPCF